jgi:hypothetical protein
MNTTDGTERQPGEDNDDGVEVVNTQTIPLQEQQQSSNTLAKVGLGCLPVVWLLLSLLKRSAVVWPLVFLPAVVFLAVWKIKKRHEIIGFWALTSAFMKGFIVGAPVLLFQELWILLYALILERKMGFSRLRLIAFLCFFIFVVGWSSEFTKYYFAKKVRIDRPEIIDIRAFLWYSVAVALGLSTFNASFVSLSSGFGLHLNPYAGMVLVIFVDILLGIPSDLLTGYLIGVGIVKNEVLKWNLSGFKIWRIPMLIRTVGAFLVYVVYIVLGQLILAILLYIVLIATTSWYVWRESKSLPESFQVVTTAYDESTAQDTNA